MTIPQALSDSNRKLSEVVKAALAAGAAKADIQAITGTLPPQLRDRTAEQIEDAIAQVQALHDPGGSLPPLADPDAALLAVSDAAPKVQPALADMLGTAEAKEKSELHLAALGYIEKGYRIIPIAPGKKTPMLKKWHENALETEQEVDDFWSVNPECNIAFCPEDIGWAIVDLDPGGDVTALDLPATFEVATPRSGTHYYFKGSVPPSASKLGPHIDTRGKSSYALIPPSLVDGKAYQIQASRPIADLPAEIEAKLAPRVEPSTANVHETDLAANIARAQQRLRDLVASGRVAIEGRGGDNFTYQVGCELVRDLGLTPDKALELMLSDFNPHCIPPWSPDELRAKLGHVAEYGQNQEGTYAVQPAAEAFKDFKADPAKQEPAKQEPEKRDTLDNDPTQERDVQRWMKRLGVSRPIDDVNLPTPQWWDDDKTIQRGDPEGYVVLYQGAKGVMKTFLTLSKLTVLVRDKKARVAYIAGEGSYGVRTVRIQAVAKAHGVSLEELSKYWITFSSAANLFNAAACEALGHKLDAFRPDFVVIDTLGQASPGQDLNSPAFGTALTEATKFIRERYGCVVILIHHLGKDEKRGALGSSMIIADPGTICEFRKIKGTPNMREEWVHHVREGEGERSLGYRLITTPSVHGVPAPVPVRVSDLELMTAKAKAKSSEDKKADKETMEADTIRAYLIEKGAFDNLSGIPTVTVAQVVWNKQREMRGELVERPKDESEQVQWQGEIKAISNRLNKAAHRHLAAREGMYARLCGYGAPEGKNLRWFVRKEDLELLVDNSEELENE